MQLTCWGGVIIGSRVYWRTPQQWNPLGLRPKGVLDNGCSFFLLIHILRLFVSAEPWARNSILNEWRGDLEALFFSFLSLSYFSYFVQLCPHSFPFFTTFSETLPTGFITQAILFSCVSFSNTNSFFLSCLEAQSRSRTSKIHPFRPLFL